MSANGGHASTSASHGGHASTSASHGGACVHVGPSKRKFEATVGTDTVSATSLVPPMSTTSMDVPPGATHVHVQVPAGMLVYVNSRPDQQVTVVMHAADPDQGCATLSMSPGGKGDEEAGGDNGYCTSSHAGCMDGGECKVVSIASSGPPVSLVCGSAAIDVLVRQVVAASAPEHDDPASHQGGLKGGGAGADCHHPSWTRTCIHAILCGVIKWTVSQQFSDFVTHVRAALAAYICANDERGVGLTVDVVNEALQGLQCLVDRFAFQATVRHPQQAAPATEHVADGDASLCIDVVEATACTGHMLFYQLAPHEKKAFRPLCNRLYTACVAAKAHSSDTRTGTGSGSGSHGWREQVDRRQQEAVVRVVFAAVHNIVRHSLGSTCCFFEQTHAACAACAADDASQYKHTSCMDP